MADLSKFNINGQTANIKDATARQLIQNLQDNMFPIGYILHCSDCDTESKVIAKYGGTHWANISGRVIVGANSTYTQGSTGGSADAVVVSHTHANEAHNHTQNAHTHTQNAHTHIQNAHTHVQNAHTHTNTVSSSGNHHHTIPAQGGTGQGYCCANHLNDYGTWNSGDAGDHTHTVTINNATPTNQNTTATNQNTTATNQNTTATNNSSTITINSSGVSGAGKNMMPYIAEYIWERIS